MEQAAFFGPPTTTPPNTVSQRTRERARRREAVLDKFERTTGMTRLAVARKIAAQLAHQREFVTVAMVRAEFVRRYGESAWTSESGTTYWTGAIFRNQPDWVCVGTGPSPDNHSADNRRWQLIAEAR